MTSHPTGAVPRSNVEHTAALRIPLVLIPMGVSLLLSLYCASGYYASDDVTYLSSILHLAQGEPLEVTLGALRYPLILPGALVHTLFGSSFLTICFSAFYHPLIIFITFLLGRRIGGESTGLISASGVAVSPLIYLYSGTLLPDTTQTFWIACWFLSLTLGLQRELSPARRNLFLFLAALCNGLAYFTKESGLILAPVGALFAFSAGSRRSEQIFLFCLYSAGIAFCFLGELLLIYTLSGDWLWRLDVVGEPENIAALQQRTLRQGLYPWERFEYWYGRTVRFVGEIPLYVVGISFLLYPLLPRRSWLLWLTALWLFLYFTFGTTSFSTYLPPSIQDRYYAPLVVPCSIVVAHLLSSALSLLFRETGDGLQNSWRHRVTVGICAAIIGAGIARASTMEEYAGSVYRSREVRAFVKALHVANDSFPDIPIFLSQYYERRMGPLLRLNGYELPLSTPIPEHGGQYIVIRPYRFGRTLQLFPHIEGIPPEQILECSLQVSTSRTRLSALLENNRELLQTVRPTNSLHPEESRDALLQLITPVPGVGRKKQFFRGIRKTLPKQWKCAPGTM